MHEKFEAMVVSRQFLPERAGDVKEISGKARYLLLLLRKFDEKHLAAVGTFRSVDIL